MHLCIDGHGGNPDLLGNETVVLHLLRHLPQEMGMNIIRDAQIINFDGGAQPNTWGITGDVIIAESHIHIHTYPDYRAVYADVFSCKDFDAGHVKSRIFGAFGLSPVLSRLQVVDRDLDRLLTKPPEVSNANGEHARSYI